MKSLKFASVLAVMAGSMFFFSSCSKKNDTVNTVSKDQIVGKWTTSMIVAATTQEVQVELKNNGVSTLDVLPYDGVAEFSGTWELNGTSFTGHFTYSGNPDFARFDAQVNSKTFLSGPLKFGGQNGTFTMAKQ